MADNGAKFYLLELPHDKMFVDVCGQDAQLVSLLVQAMEKNPNIDRLLVTAVVYRCSKTGRSIDAMLREVNRIIKP